jgi:hypothetical protein
MFAVRTRPPTLKRVELLAGALVTTPLAEGIETAAL